MGNWREGLESWLPLPWRSAQDPVVVGTKDEPVLTRRPRRFALCQKVLPFCATSSATSTMEDQGTLPDLKKCVRLPKKKLEKTWIGRGRDRDKTSRWHCTPHVLSSVKALERDTETPD